MIEDRGWMIAKMPPASAAWRGAMAGKPTSNAELQRAMRVYCYRGPPHPACGHLLPQEKVSIRAFIGKAAWFLQSNFKHQPRKLSGQRNLKTPV